MSRPDPDSTRSATQSDRGDTGGTGSDPGREGAGATRGRSSEASGSGGRAEDGGKSGKSGKSGNGGNGGNGGKAGSRKAGSGKSRPSAARRVETFFTRELWSRELATLPTFRRILYGFARVAQLTVANFVKDRCSWRASALTYITVLSLVPLLALAFSVAKGMGAYETLRTRTIDPFLESTFGGDAADGETASPEGDAQGGETGEAGAASEGADGGSAADGSTEGALEIGGAESGGADPGGADPGGASPDGTEPSSSDPGSSDPGSSGAEGAAQEPGESPVGAESAQVPDPQAGAPATSELEEDLASVLAPDDSGAASTADAEGGAQVREALEMVLEFVEKTNVSSLGALGFLLVIFTVIKLLGAIELSFNDIWGVYRARSLPRKIADYFSTVVLVPVLLVTGTGLLRLAQSERFESALGLGGEDNSLARFGSFAVVWLAFAFAYILMPNTRIRITSALVGGVVGGTMWQLFQWAHVELQVGVANYNAIYSTFAALPIFLFWVQSSWMTVLLGAEAAAAHQNQARHGQLVRSRDYDLAQKEVIALRLMARLTSAFLAGRGPRPSGELADDLACPDRVLEEVAVGLEEAGLVASVEDDTGDEQLLLSADPGKIRIQDVLDALKGRSRSEPAPAGEPAPADAAIDRAFEEFRAERDAVDGNRTLRDLAQDETDD